MTYVIGLSQAYVSLSQVLESESAGGLGKNSACSSLSCIRETYT